MMEEQEMPCVEATDALEDKKGSGVTADIGLSCSGNTTLSAEETADIGLSCSGNTTLSAEETADIGVSCSGNTTLSAGETADIGLSCSENTTLSAEETANIGVSCSGNTTLSAEETADIGLSCSGNTTLSAEGTADIGVSCSGNTTLSAGETADIGLSCSGNTTLSAGETADIDISCSGNTTLSAEGTADIGLSCSGNTTLSAEETANVGISCSGYKTLSAGETANIGISCSGNTTLSAEETADIGISCSGNTTLSAEETEDIGLSCSGYKTLSAGETANIGLSCSGNTTLSAEETADSKQHAIPTFSNSCSQNIDKDITANSQFTCSTSQHVTENSVCDLAARDPPFNVEKGATVTDYANDQLSVCQMIYEKSEGLLASCDHLDPQTLSVSQTEIEDVHNNYEDVNTKESDGAPESMPHTYEGQKRTESDSEIDTSCVGHTGSESTIAEESGKGVENDLCPKSTITEEAGKGVENDLCVVTNLCSMESSQSTVPPGQDSTGEKSMFSEQSLPPNDTDTALAPLLVQTSQTATSTSSACYGDDNCSHEKLADSAAGLSRVGSSAASTTCANQETGHAMSVADISLDRIKEEPIDTGYEHALTATSRRKPDIILSSEELSQITKAVSGGNTTTTIRQGKKRVKVTVVRGEWRSPSQVKHKYHETTKTPQRQLPAQGTPSRTQAQRSAVIAKPATSAFPIALFRNAHIKTEPVDDGYPQPDQSATSATTTSTGAKTAKGGASNKVQPVSSSLFSERRQIRNTQQRGRLSLRDKAAAVSASTGQHETISKESVGNKTQPCSVQMTRLSPDILAAGMVNIKIDPQILQSAVATSLRKRPPDRRKPWQCEQCGKSYKTKSARTQHYKVHQGVREHVCSLCGASFVYKSVLTSHYRFVHLGEKPYTCSVCGKGFAWSSHLTVHLKLHYEEKSYTCPICHNLFHSFYIKQHLASHSDYKPFGCDNCHKRYKSKKGLQEHQKVHSGYKPFKCSRCGQQFSYKSSLIIHERTHTGERPYQCQQCPATFTQSTHLRTHLKGVHKMTQLPCRRFGREVVKRVVKQSSSSTRNVNTVSPEWMMDSDGETQVTSTSPLPRAGKPKFKGRVASRSPGNHTSEEARGRAQQPKHDHRVVMTVGRKHGQTADRVKTYSGFDESDKQAAPCRVKRRRHSQMGKRQKKTRLAYHGHRQVT